MNIHANIGFVGFKPRGFISIDLTKQLANVSINMPLSFNDIVLFIILYSSLINPTFNLSPFTLII